MNDTLHCDRLEGARFAGERTELEALRADSEIAPRLEAAARRCDAAEGARRHFLSDAVRVDERLLPGLAGALADVASRAKLDLPMEAFVYGDPSVNGSVLRTASRLIIVLSSGAVERLSGPELDFVIGHEIGHAAYGHLEVPVRAVLSEGALDARQAMRLMAWHRKAEISADRAGMICCGSLDVAATALFKMLSGLALPGATIDPEHFANQWSELAGEVAREAARGAWQATHPFPALRMKALLEFHATDRAASMILGAPGVCSIADADRAVESMLATMDPIARERSDVADPILASFVTWGGLYVAACSGDLGAAEIARVERVAGRDAVAAALRGERPSALHCRDRFVAARSERRTPLSALELHRIFSALATVATTDGAADAAERGALVELAGLFGVSSSFIESALRDAA